MLSALPTIVGHVCYSRGRRVSNDGANWASCTGISNPHRVMGKGAPHAKHLALNEQSRLSPRLGCICELPCKVWLLLAYGVSDSGRGGGANPLMGSVNVAMPS